MPVYILQRHYLSPETSIVGIYDNLHQPTEIANSQTNKIVFDGKESKFNTSQDGDNFYWMNDLLGLVFSITKTELNKGFETDDENSNEVRDTIYSDDFESRIVVEVKEE